PICPAHAGVDRTGVTEDALLIIGEITINVLLCTPHLGGCGAFVGLVFFCTYCLWVSVRCAGVEQTHAPHLRATQSTFDCEGGWVLSSSAPWPPPGGVSRSAMVRPSTTLDWGDLEQTVPRATSAPMLFSAGWVCSAVTSFPVMRFCSFAGSSRIISSMNFGVASVSRSSLRSCLGVAAPKPSEST